MPTTPLPICKDRGLLVFDVDIHLFVFLLYVAQLSVNSKPTMSTEPRYQSAFLLLLSFFVTTPHPIQCIIVTLSHPFPFHVISTIQAPPARTKLSYYNGSPFPCVSDTYVGGGYKPLSHISSKSLGSKKWKPTKALPVIRSSHPLDVSCAENTLKAIQAYCNQEADDKIAMHPVHPLIYVQVKHLRSLISHSSMISDVVVTFYLELLTKQYDITYLSTSFLTTLRLQGWDRLQSHFALYRNRPRTNSRPNMTGEPVIILPCFVNGCHWVTVVRREVNGRTLFFYADDLN